MCVLRRQVPLTGPTNMRSGLEDVSNYLMADCVYLVSDGRADSPIAVRDGVCNIEQRDCLYSFVVFARAFAFVSRRDADHAGLPLIGP